MGRKFEESLVVLGKQRAERRQREEQAKRKQWEDLDKLVPAYALNESGSGDSPAKPARANKTSNLRNDGTQAKRLTDEEVKKLAKGITLSPVKDLKQAESRREQKKKQRERVKRRKALQAEALDRGDINGAEVLSSGSKPQKPKPTKAPASNGKSSSPSKETRSPSASEASFISLKDLKPGPVVPVSYKHSEETSADFFVTTPSDEETMATEDDDSEGFSFIDQEAEPNFLKMFGAVMNGKLGKSAADSDEDEEEEDSEGVEDEDEIFGPVIDLEDESDGMDEEESPNDSDLDFIDDGSAEEGAEDGEYESESGSEGERKGAVENGSGMEVDDEYNSAEDSDFESEEEDEEPFVAEIGADEINELLVDSCRDKEEESDSSDEDELSGDGGKDLARLEFLLPESIANKRLDMAVSGHNCDEPNPCCVVVTKEEEGEQPATPDFSLFCFSKDEDEHSVQVGVNAFRWLIGPVENQVFFEHIYGKRALVVHRGNADYFKNFFPVTSFYRMFQEHFLEYGVNINVASYKNGQRTTHNGEGRVFAGNAAQHLADGKSIQCVNPQSFDKHIHYLCDVLQEIFNSFVGANCYFTPKGSAGFAPHFDDIDAFLVQVEGRKYWKVYAPDDTDSIWPLKSSHNFSKAEMKQREESLVFEGWLEAGDLLYIPRGFIHCAHTDKAHDSLHVTVSVAQQLTYSELMKAVVEKLADTYTQSFPRLRSQLPINYAEICGVSDGSYDLEDLFLKRLDNPLSVVLGQMEGDVSVTLPAAVDDLARQFMRRALPPLLSDYEKAHSVHGALNKVPRKVTFGAETEVRLIRKHTQRLLFESETQCFIGHRLNNSMVYEGRPETVLDVPHEWAAVVEVLFRNYPCWSALAELCSDAELAARACRFLYDRGLLLVNMGRSKKQSVQVVVAKNDSLVGVLKKSNRNSSLDKSTDSERKVTFSPEVRVKNIQGRPKRTEPVELGSLFPPGLFEDLLKQAPKKKGGKVEKKKKPVPVAKTKAKGKTRSGNKKAKNKFRN